MGLIFGYSARLDVRRLAHPACLKRSSSRENVIILRFNEPCKFTSGNLN